MQSSEDIVEGGVEMVVSSGEGYYVDGTADQGCMSSIGGFGSSFVVPLLIISCSVMVD